MLTSESHDKRHFVIVAAEDLQYTVHLPTGMAGSPFKLLSLSTWPHYFHSVNVTTVYDFVLMASSTGLMFHTVAYPSINSAQ